MLIKRLKRNIAIVLSMSMILGGGTIISNADEGVGSDLIPIEQSVDNDTSDINTILEINDMTEESLIEEKAIQDNLDENASYSEMFSEGQQKLIKVEFQAKYGIEDTFKVISNEDGIKVEVNGANGIMKTTEFDENGNIKSSFTVNYFDSIDNLGQRAPELDQTQTQTQFQTMSTAPARPSAWRTQGPDKANLKVVKGSTRDTITATHVAFGWSKTFTKDTNNWYSGGTKGYYIGVQNAR